MMIHSSKFAAYTLLSFALFLMGCSSSVTKSPRVSKTDIQRETDIQKTMVLQQKLDEEARVDAISYFLRRTNTELCGDTKHEQGFRLWNSYSVFAKDRKVAKKLYGLSKYPSVKNVSYDSAAWQAGLRTGDVIKQVNSKPIKESKGSPLKTVKLIEDQKAINLNLLVERQGQHIPITIQRKRVCDYETDYLYNDKNVNAYADGHRIYITRGMYQFTNNDEELALVIAHELSHNAVDHRDKKMGNAIGGLITGFVVDAAAAAAGIDTKGRGTKYGAAIGQRAHSISFEKEADYIGMYMMARTGYDTGQVANFWRRIATEVSDKAITVRRTHPTSVERFVAIEKTHQEILDKRRDGLPLYPNKKEGR